MAIQVIDSAGTFRLISDGSRYAVVEARAGHVYSLHGHDRREAPDGEDGMARVVGDDGWFGEAEARHCFDEAVKGGEGYSRIIW
jgi:hypothetical protein